MNQMCLLKEAKDSKSMTDPICRVFNHHQSLCNCTAFHQFTNSSISLFSSSPSPSPSPPPSPSPSPSSPPAPLPLRSPSGCFSVKTHPARRCRLSRVSSALPLPFSLPLHISLEREDRILFFLSALPVVLFFVCTIVHFIIHICNCL